MEEVKRKLEAAIEQVYGVKFEASVTVAPEDTGADFASNVAMQLAKLVHKAPVTIAEELKDTFLAEDNGAWQVEIAGPGFMNFISPDEYFYEKVTDFAENLENLTKNILWDEYDGKTVVCEFSDPNPFKVLHVGHLYTSMVGDSISRILEMAGAKVVRVNFGGDVGLHVGKTIYALMYSESVRLGFSDARTCLLSESQPAKASCHSDKRKSGLNLISASENPNIDILRIHQCKDNSLHMQPHIPDEFEEFLEGLTIEQIAKAYVEGTRAYEEDEQAKAEITAINRMVYEIALEKFGGAKEWPGGDTMGTGAEVEMSADDRKKIEAIYLRGRELSYQYFKDFYARIGVKFDRYYPESTVAVRGLKEVRQGLDRGVYEESNGAVVYKGEKFGLHTRVFINREGVPTYEAKDVGLIFTKWDDYHFDESVVVTGNEQTEYMKVVLASVAEYAPKLVERTSHLTHGLVKLPGNEKMSSRKGNFLKAVDVIELVARELDSSLSTDAMLAHRTPSTARCASPVSSNSPNSRATETDERIVLAALRYAFLKYKMGGDIIFDPKESVAMTGNSGVYLLYSAVRAKKVLQRVGGAALLASDRTGEPFVRKLSKKIVQYQDILKEAVAEKAPNKICAYLFELAQEFSRFYENVKVVGSENEAELIVIVRAYVNVMEHGLGLLGIEVPEEM